MRWRKATWALIIWTALMAAWLFYALANPATSEERYVPFVIVFTAVALILCWFVGLVILALVWFMSRPKANTPITGSPITHSPGIAPMPSRSLRAVSRTARASRT